MKVAILSSPNQWFIPYAKQLQEKLPSSQLYHAHEDINEHFDVLFILSYHRIIEEKFLHHDYNIVVHASALPKGKGWAPMFWQILEGKNSIPFSMFEASQGVDNGDIYIQKELTLTGYELHDELRHKQANFIISMCLEFLDSPQTPKPQEGEESFYPKRCAKDAELDINKSIKEQFNLLRICSNKDYPAFFTLDGKKYRLKIDDEPF